MIIGLVGKAGAGKDEFAKVAKEKFGAVRVAFADVVKEEVAEFLQQHEVCFEHRHLWGSQMDKEVTLRMAHYNRLKSGRLADFVTLYGDYHEGYHYFTPRSLLQFWGTEYRREQDPDYWVKQAERKMQDSDKLYVVTDCRFINEIKMIRNNCGTVVKIVRPDATVISNMSHQSETELQAYSGQNYQIDNIGTLEAFHQAIVTTMENILHGR